MSKTVTVKAVHAVTICVKPGKAKTATSAAVPAELKRVEPGTKMTMDADEAADLARIGAVLIVASEDAVEGAEKPKKGGRKPKPEAAAAAGSEGSGEGSEGSGDDDDEGKSLV